jgi:hypothetical protein
VDPPLDELVAPVLVAPPTAELPPLDPTVPPVPCPVAAPPPVFWPTAAPPPVTWPTAAPPPPLDPVLLDPAGLSADGAEEQAASKKPKVVTETARILYIFVPSGEVRSRSSGSIARIESPPAR